MKKTLIALAAFGAMAGVAQAQSSVTLYGVVDAGIGQVNTKTGTSTGETESKQTVVNSSGITNSRWGMRGTEDLGNGLKALFVLEAGYNTDTGTTAQTSAATGTTVFGRQAIVGVSGGFGTVTLGRQDTAYDALASATNHFANANFATTSAVWATGLATGASRANNSIGYTTPTFSGFSASAVYGFGENETTTPAADAESNASIHIKYVNGPIFVGYGYQAEKQNALAGGSIFATPSTSGGASTGATASGTRKYNLIAGSYDFGMAKLNAGYNTAKFNGTEDDEYHVGVTVPFGAASVGLGYSKSESETGGVTLEGEGISLLGLYSLSKRTTAYFGVASTEVDTSATNYTKVNRFLTGLRHTF